MKFVPLTNVNKIITSTSLNNESIAEVFHCELENAVKEMLSTKLTAFLDYKKNDYASHNTGNNRNGIYDRSYPSRFGSLILKITSDQKKNI